MLMNRICESVRPIAAEHVAADIRIGLGYTAVLLENGSCGVAYTPHKKNYECCTVIPESGTLSGRNAWELASWAGLPDETARAVGLATINAVITPPQGAIESDILDLLPIRPDDSVGMIGYFGPLAGPIKQRARTLHVFERQPDPESGVLPEDMAPELLPQCGIVLISATALLNGTMDALLDCCSAAREITILGPSTPFVPEVFRDQGVTMLSGMQIVDPAKILRTISEGGGTHSFGRAARKLTIRI
jgi:uncharacterized protein